MSRPGGGPAGAAPAGGTYGRSSNGFDSGSLNGRGEANDYDVTGKGYGSTGVGDAYESHDGYGQADGGGFGSRDGGLGGFGHDEAGGYGAGGLGDGHESGTGAYESGIGAYESGDGGYEAAGADYDDGGYGAAGADYDNGYGADDGSTEQATGDPNYKARRHRPSANDTNVGTLADFAAFGGYERTDNGVEPRADERYVQGYGDHGRW